MELKLISNSIYRGRSIDCYEVAGGLTLEKCASYISDLVKSGLTFKSGVISSLSDKDNWKTFSGNANYSDYHSFMTMLQSKTLESEERVSAELFGTQNRVDIQIGFDIDFGNITFYTPVNKNIDA